MTLSRRMALLALGGMAVARPSFAQSTPHAPSLVFRILRNDGQIGTHTLTFATTDQSLTVGIATDIKVGLGPITLYRYTHRAEERWQRGVFVSLDAETNDNGSVARTTVRRDADGLLVEGQQIQPYRAPADALPLTHWNRGMLAGPMISTQTGALLHPTVSRVGSVHVVTTAGGIEADHYTLRGDPDIDTWYDAHACWAGQKLTARDGSIIRYERVRSMTT